MKITLWLRNIANVLVWLVIVGLVGISLPVEAQPSRAVLNVGWPWDPENLDPGADWTQAGFTIRRLVYEGLIRLTPSGELAPELATSWQVSPDQRVYTFRLRQGVKFHDGTTFDAKAAKFGLDRASSVRGGPFFPNLGDSIQSVDVVDTHTIRITLKQPYAPFLFKMGAIWARVFVCPKRSGGDLSSKWYKDNMCGTGPYRFEAWVRETRVLVRRFREYWGGWGIGTPIEAVNFIIVREASTRRLRIERGDLDVAVLIPLQDLEGLAKKPGVKVLAFVDRPLVQQFLWMISGKPPLDNVKVRQAISYAISYDKIVKDIMKGYAKQAVGPIPAGLWAHDPSTPAYRRNIAKAKALLKEAGLSQPTGITLRLMWFTGFEEQRLWAQQIQSDLAEIGINVQPLEATSAVARQMFSSLQRAPEMVTYFTGEEVDPDDYVYRFHSSQVEPVGRNEGWYSNGRVDELLDKARSVLDRKERAKLYSEVQKLVVQDAAALFLYTVPNIIVMRDKIAGFQYVPFYGIAMNVRDMRKTR